MTTRPTDSDSRWTNLLIPRFRYGDIVPPGDGTRRGPAYQFYRLVPVDVMQVSVGLGIRDYTPDGVADAMTNFWGCVEALAAEAVDHIVLGGVPVSSQLGRPRVLELVREARERTGVGLDTPLETMLAGLRHLGAARVVIASRWADQLNEAMVAYLEHGGIEVVGVTSRNQWASQAFGMTLEEGLQMALDVGREAARLAPQADAILVPGGSAMSLHVVPALEEEFGKPVLTNMTSEVWSILVHTGVIEPVQGWGQLLAGA